MNTTEEKYQKAAKDLAESAARIQTAFLPLQQALLHMAEAFSLAFAPLSALLMDLGAAEAERAAKEEIDRQAMMAVVTRLTWRVVGGIVAARVAWWLWL